MLKLSGQQDQQIVDIHSLGFAWMPMVDLSGTRLEQLNTFKGQPQAAIAAAQVVLKKYDHELLKHFARNLQLIVDQTFIWVDMASLKFFTLMGIPKGIVFVFSHVVFLLLVNGVATITLAGCGVAFYLGGTV
ncbi:hypothetical protein [Vreelandella venusta]|uniref:Uncharacterized protein n=1 Tax=Vreelandella venusta TaxID=44935 RepID=A0ABX2B9Q5_9GAMM|nr:hypothetical protein [Halomonas venusta]AZM95859.1 hypothetical protein EI420_09250 [Halomonas venusta]NPT30863.1 hypothetical protein [Halomonas venusta]